MTFIPGDVVRLKVEGHTATGLVVGYSIGVGSDKKEGLKIIWLNPPEDGLYNNFGDNDYYFKASAHSRYEFVYHLDAKQLITLLEEESGR